MSSSAIITPSGKYLGRKRPSPDPRDRRFMHSHPEAKQVSLPTKVDLRAHLPPCYDQGELGSCGANAGSGLMAFLYPEIPVFSRLQIYYDVRVLENDVSQDGGVETRDVLKTLTNMGAAPESEWPYNVDEFTQAPPVEAVMDAEEYRLSEYSSLVTEEEYLSCLASGYPFLLGFTVYSGFDSDRVASTGVMYWPDVKKEVILGGHDVLAVGYDLNFKSSAAFKNSGADKRYCSNAALLIRNSWGVNWGYEGGHFWMPLAYAVNPQVGGDAWTGRK